METQNKANWKKFWPLLFILVPIGIYLFIYSVMFLWNAILPEVIGVKEINFWQAGGIFLLCKILFGGFNYGNHKHKGNAYSSLKMKEKLMNMSEEEKEQFKSEWRSRCGKEC